MKEQIQNQNSDSAGAFPLPPTKEDGTWVRLPKVGDTREGLDRSALSELGKKKLILTVSLGTSGKRGKRLIYLPSLHDYLAAECMMQNCGPGAEETFLDMLDVVILESGNSVRLTAARVADILMSHPASRDLARRFLVGPRAAEIHLHAVAVAFPKRVKPEYQAINTFWHISK